jgi:single-stranded-DNA-specific exonuclease
MEKNWYVKATAEEETCEAIRKLLTCDRVLASLLVQRGIDTFEKARTFFNPDLNSLHDPFLMKNMSKGVDRISKALKNNEKILIFGDYDVDGTTAVALMYSFLKKHTTNINFYIPDRYKEGYGLSLQGVEYAAQNNVTLMLTLDCGIRSVDLIALAKNKGIDVIVCDHHEPGERIPDCIVLDPKQTDCIYPYKGLSGCGVAFKLLHGLTKKQNWDIETLFSYLDLVAISIGADIVDITGENRILAFHGLNRLNAHPRMAFRELIKLAGKTFPLSLSTVVFTIAPRINAAGRLRSGRFAVELMISEDYAEIERIAHEINEDNQNRRIIDEIITQEAVAMIESNEFLSEARSIVVYHPEWHKGVVGIVASRLVERYFKPAIVLTSSNDVLTGSARTVKDFDIHAAISSCEHLLEQYGGHTHAAGISLQPMHLESFRQAFEKVVSDSLNEIQCVPEVLIDLEISFSEIFKQGESVFTIPRLKRNLLRFEPHGPGNMQPVFMTRNVYSLSFKILKESHLKLSVIDPETDIILSGIGFNLAEKADCVVAGMRFDIVYTLEINVWNDKKSLQLNIRDIRSSL